MKSLRKKIGELNIKMDKVQVAITWGVGEGLQLVAMELKNLERRMLI